MRKKKGKIPQQIGDYKIEKFLGHGGMATIYLGTDPKGRKAAIKVIRYDYADEQNFNERFHRECKATSCLSHPNIVELYEFGSFEGQPFYAMEYLPYPTMEDRLENHELFSEKELLKISKKVISAMASYGQRGLVHRDLKPSNVLLKDGTEPIIMDFGLVFNPDNTALTKTGEVCGTPAYMPPELLKGQKADLRSDLYQWGIVLYECLCGELPIGRPDPAMAFTMILKGELRPLKEAKPDVTPGFATFVANLMSILPAHRYQNPEAAIVDIEHLLSGGNIRSLSVEERIEKEKPAIASGALSPVTAPTKAPEVPVKKSYRPTLLWLTTLLLLVTLFFSLRPRRESPTPKPKIAIGFNVLLLTWNAPFPLKSRATLRDKSGKTVTSKELSEPTRHHRFRFSLNGLESQTTVELTLLPNGPTSLPRAVKRQELFLSIDSLKVTDKGLLVRLHSRRSLQSECVYVISAIDRQGRTSKGELTVKEDKYLEGLMTGMGADIASLELTASYGPTAERVRIDLRTALENWAKELVRTLEKVSINEIIGAMVVRTTSAALDRTGGTTIFSADGTYRLGKVEELNSEGRVEAYRKLVKLQTWAKEQSWTKNLLQFARRQEFLLSSSLFDLEEQFRICKNARLVNILNHCFLARNWLPFSERLYSFGPYWTFYTRGTKPENFEWRPIKSWSFNPPTVIGEESRAFLRDSDHLGKESLTFQVKSHQLQGMKRVLVCIQSSLLKKQVYILARLNEDYDFLHSAFLTRRKGSGASQQPFFHQHLDIRTLREGENTLTLQSRVFPGFMCKNTTIKIPFVAVYVQ